MKPTKWFLPLFPLQNLQVPGSFFLFNFPPDFIVVIYGRIELLSALVLNSRSRKNNVLFLICSCNFSSWILAYISVIGNDTKFSLPLQVLISILYVLHQKDWKVLLFFPDALGALQMVLYHVFFKTWIECFCNVL
jgi:hypothetical protein